MSWMGSKLLWTLDNEDVARLSRSSTTLKNVRMHFLHHNIQKCPKRNPRNVDGANKVMSSRFVIYFHINLDCEPYRCEKSTWILVCMFILKPIFHRSRTNCAMYIVKVCSTILPDTSLSNVLAAQRGETIFCGLQICFLTWAAFLKAHLKVDISRGFYCNKYGNCGYKLRKGCWQI